MASIAKKAEASQGSKTVVPAVPVKQSAAVTYKKPCHIGVVSPFRIGMAAIYGGAHRDFDRDRGTWDLRIRMAGDSGYEVADFARPNVVTAYHGAQLMFPDSVLRPKAPTPTLDVTWDDMDLPELSSNWWHDLVDTIKRWKEPKNIGISCFGGHGRTGTSLAILATLSSNVPIGECPVAWLRKHYCAHAVETRAQYRYVEVVTGVQVNIPPEPPKKVWVNNGYVTGQGYHDPLEDRWAHIE